METCLDQTASRSPVSREQRRPYECGAAYRRDMVNAEVMMSVTPQWAAAVQMRMCTAVNY